MATERVCQVAVLGRTPYEQAWALQKRLAAARGTDAIPDTLLFVEHPHTYTLGSAGNANNLLLTPEEQAAWGVSVHRVDRGGDITYHGPGQIVAYPILKLPPSTDGLHADVVAYVRQLEQVIIAALAEFGIAAQPYPPLTGVWTPNADGVLAKIAAIGVRVTTKRVAFHGFALNVNTDLRYFTGIIPCGIADKPVTSLAALRGPQDESAVRAALCRAFAATFDTQLTPVSEADVYVV